MSAIIKTADPLNPTLVEAFLDYAQTRGILVESYRPRLKPTLNESDPPPDGPAQKPKTHPRTAGRRRR